MYVYDPKRHDFSRKASKIAFARVYAPILGAISLERLDSAPEGPTDPDLRGTDVVLTLNSGRRVTVAERFRRAQYIGYDDVTLRCSSLQTGRKLEVVGLNAQYMLYAVVNEEETDFLRWDLLYGPRLVEVVEALKFQAIPNINGSSTFLPVPRKILFRSGAVAATSERSGRICAS